MFPLLSHAANGGKLSKTYLYKGLNKLCWLKLKLWCPMVLPLSRLCGIVVYSINPSFLICHMNKHYPRIVLEIKENVGKAFDIALVLRK